MRAGHEQLATTLQGVVEALVEGDRQDAHRRIADIAFSPAQLKKRPSIPTRLMVTTFTRDRFTCRYCESRTVIAPVMRLVSDLFPAEFPRHPNWKTDATHIAYWTIFASVDHVVAGTSGGDWLDPNNLVTACWTCNAQKSNHSLEDLGWKVAPISTHAWDGLTDAYPRLWDLAGKPEPRVHRPWLAAIAAAGSS